MKKTQCIQSWGILIILVFVVWDQGRWLAEDEEPRGIHASLCAEGRVAISVTSGRGARSKGKVCLIQLLRRGPTSLQKNRGHLKWKAVLWCYFFKTGVGVVMSFSKQRSELLKDEENTENRQT